jgi:putative Holliday junction resolvase
VDPGTRRVGVAFVGPLALVQPLGFFNAAPREELLRKIAALASARQCVGLVVGLPLHMSGEEGSAARAARTLGEELARATGLPVDFWDERLTSAAADRSLRALGLTGRQRKARSDEVAAAMMLESYVAARRAAARQ